MSRCWHQVQERRKFLTDDGGKRAVLRGEHEASRKAIAQGRPGCSACTCMLVCMFCLRKSHTGSRVQRAPGLPCVLISSRGPNDAKLGRKMSRERETISASLRAQRSNPPRRLPRDGLLRCARNDADRSGRIRSAGSRFTTFTCINDSGYNASLAETLQSREQSVVPKMRPFKLQMAGQQCSIFLVARSARSADDLISTYQVRKNQRRRTGIAASPTK